MKQKYIDRRTGKVIELDDTAPNFETLRQQYEMQGYEWERPEADPNVTTYDATVSGNGAVIPPKAKAPVNIQTQPGASYEQPATARPERDISGGVDLNSVLDRFRPVQTPSYSGGEITEAAQKAAQATAPTPTPTPGIPVTQVPTAMPTPQMPSATPKPPQSTPAPTPQPQREVAGVKEGEVSDSPLVAPAGIPAQQGNMGFQRPNMGFPADKPQAPIKPLTEPLVLPPEMAPEAEIAPTAQPQGDYRKSIAGKDYLSQPTLTSQPDSPLNQKDSDPVQLQQAAQQQPTPQSLGLTGAPTATPAPAPAPAPTATPAPKLGDMFRNQPAFNTQAMQNFGVNEKTVPGGKPASIPPADAVSQDPYTEPQLWLKEHEFDLGGQSQQPKPEKPTPVPESPFAPGMTPTPEGETNVTAPIAGSDGSNIVPSGAPGMGADSGLQAQQGEQGQQGQVNPDVKQAALKDAMSLLDKMGRHLKDLNVETSSQAKQFDPQMKSEAEQAYYGAKTKSQDTMQELSDRFSGIDKERLERIKELATARGTAFEKYTSDLNANEQKSFWSHIINGLGKILVGGYDIMSGPKTAAASQYYKGPDAFDLQGANASAKQKYDAEIKNIESIEADKQAADQNFMDTKIALANMQRGMSKDVYEMVTNLMDLTSTMNKAGYSSAFITPGMIQLLMDERDFNMRKLMYEELQKNARAKLEADQKTVTAGIVAKGQKTVQAQNTEQKTNYEQDTPRYAQDKNSVNTLLAYKHLIPSGLMGVTEVAETKAAADAFRANPNNETFTAYKSALEQKYAPQYKIGIETLQTRGKIDANTAREMGDGLDMAIRSFTPERAIRHPLYSGIDGLNAMPSWIEEQVNDKSPTGYYNKLSGSSVLGSSNRQEESITRKGSAAPKEQPPATAPATPTSGSESGTPATQPTSAAATATAIPPTPAPLTTAKPANTGTPKPGGSPTPKPGGTPKVVEPKSVKTQAPAKQTAKPAPTAQQKPTTPPTPQAAQAEIDLLTSWLDKFNAEVAAGNKPTPQGKAKFKEYYEKWKRLKGMK